MEIGTDAAYIPTGPVSWTLSSASAFNWWEENCCIFLKKISSPNAFYLFLPLFKQQTTPYNVLFFKKMKKYAFPFSFQTGTGSQWEGPHNSNNKATCMQCKFTIHYIYQFLLTIPLDSINLCQKYYKTSPTYTLLSFSH